MWPFPFTCTPPTLPMCVLYECHESNVRGCQSTVNGFNPGQNCNCRFKLTECTPGHQSDVWGLPRNVHRWDLRALDPRRHLQYNNATKYTIHNIMLQNNNKSNNLNRMIIPLLPMATETVIRQSPSISLNKRLEAFLQQQEKQIKVSTGEMRN
jgi:hypothetical protein